MAASSAFGRQSIGGGGNKRDSNILSERGSALGSEAVGDVLLRQLESQTAELKRESSYIQDAIRT